MRPTRSIIRHQNQLTIFTGILLKAQKKENENRVRTTVVNQCTWVRNQVSTFLSLVNKDLPVKDIVFTSNIHYI